MEALWTAVLRRGRERRPAGRVHPRPLVRAAEPGVRSPRAGRVVGVLQSTPPVLATSGFGPVQIQ